MDFPSIDLNAIHKMDYNQEENHNFCLVILDESNRALHTPFMCKDYLQDIFWCENTGKRTSIYGLDWEKFRLDIGSPKFKLGVLGGLESMRERSKFLQEFLNIFEGAQEIPPSVVLETDNDKNLIVEFDRAWAQNGPLLSTFTTLIRISGPYQGGDPLEYLKSMHEKFKNREKIYPQYSFVDISRLDNTLPKLNAILCGKKVLHSWSDTRDSMGAHCNGIMEFKDFPRKEIKCHS